jgi:ethylmalonyl-CoA mutase
MSVSKSEPGACRPDSPRDRPWLMRTYSGHSDPQATNALFRTNLSKGQTGLSVAFDLPTQTGYDSDHILARGEVGKVGVPVGHIEDMAAIFDGIPVGDMNTSMTINAPAAWLMALYIAVAERQGAEVSQLRGTVQNDIIKEYLSRGTYVFPPAPSMRLIADTIAYTATKLPHWNPTNICSYHLQEAGATPVQELAYALGTAIAVLDAVRDSGQVPADQFPRVVGRISFFVNAGIRFIEETCKLRAFAELWDEIARDRYGVTDEKYRRFRYGVQVNSLGLTEQQPENNVQRIVLQMLGVVLSKGARARAVQLPAWNEALGLPRPWDQQWALRMQQVLAYETDLLEYPDLLDGSPVIAAKVAELKQGALAELGRIEDMGGILVAVDKGYVKERLVESNARRLREIERGERTVIGVNRFTETAPSPLVSEDEVSVMKVDPEVEARRIAALHAFKASRDDDAVRGALAALRETAESGGNLLPASIDCAHAGVTTGEWTGTLREVFGEYRPPVVLSRVHPGEGHATRSAELLGRVRETAAALGGGVRMLVGKPGLDGHSNGAEQVALKARQMGFEVIYLGIRWTPEQIAQAALEEAVDIIGLSILSGSHMELISTIQGLLAAEEVDATLVIGGIIPPDDAAALRASGVAAIYTPKNGDMNHILAEVLDLVRARKGLDPFGELTA